MAGGAIVTKYGLRPGVQELIDASAEGRLDGYLDGLERRAEHGVRCFVRLGDLPPGGRSYHYGRHTFEPGVSVLDAFEVDGAYIIDLRGLTCSPRDMAEVLACCQRPMYRAFGDVVGRGSGGESLLKVHRLERLPDAAAEQVRIML